MKGKICCELICCTDTLLQEINSTKCKRDDVAHTYYMAILSAENVDWKTVNSAIINRWSRSALKYIKNKANKLWDNTLISVE